MFNKESYWKRRKNMAEVEIPGKGKKTMKVMVPMPLRGQQDIIPVKVYEKGDDAAGVLNALGGHRSFDTKGKMHILNREQARRKVRYHGFTKKTTDNHPTEHVYNPEKDPSNEKYVHPKLDYAPDLTNNQRMKLREIRRLDLKKAKANA